MAKALILPLWLMVASMWPFEFGVAQTITFPKDCPAWFTETQLNAAVQLVNSESWAKIENDGFRVISNIANLFHEAQKAEEEIARGTATEAQKKNHGCNLVWLQFEEPLRKSVPGLVHILVTGNSWVSQAAGHTLRAVGYLPEEELGAIVEALKNPNAEGRSQILLSLWALRSVGAPLEPALINIIQKENDKVALENAMEALSKVAPHSDSTLKLFREILAGQTLVQRTDASRVRCNAVRAFVEISVTNPKGDSDVIAAIRSDDKNLISCAAGELGVDYLDANGGGYQFLGTKRDIIGALIETLNDERTDRWAQGNVYNILKQIHSAESDNALKTFDAKPKTKTPEELAMEKIMKVRYEQTTKLLIQQLKDPNPEVVARAALALKQIGTPEALKAAQDYFDKLKNK